MKFKLEINCDNAAFEGDPSYEVRRILEELVHNMEDVCEHKLRDINGNIVGFAKFVYEKTEK